MGCKTTQKYSFFRYKLWFDLRRKTNLISRYINRRQYGYSFEIQCINMSYNYQLIFLSVLMEKHKKQLSFAKK